MYLWRDPKFTTLVHKTPSVRRYRLIFHGDRSRSRSTVLFILVETSFAVFARHEVYGCRQRRDAAPSLNNCYSQRGAGKLPVYGVLFHSTEKTRRVYLQSCVVDCELCDTRQVVKSTVFLNYTYVDTTSGAVWWGSSRFVWSKKVISIFEKIKTKKIIPEP